MKKYDLKKIMKDAWRMMRANCVGGVYQVSLSQALHFAWEVARRDLRKAECVKEIISSGKYNYIAKEKNLTNRFDLVKKAFNAFRAEGEKRRIALRNSCKENSSRPVWNDTWPYALGPLPEEEF